MKTFSPAVAQPCQENWNAMTPEEGGRFCAACKKNVVDFSNMTDRQLTEFFAGRKGNLCGRFHADQLNRQIEMPPKEGFWFRPFVPLALTALMVLVEACAPENKGTGKMIVSNSLPAAEPMAEKERKIIPDKGLTPSADTLINKGSEEKTQVITKRPKTLHPAFIPVDTLRLPAQDTATKPADTLDTRRQPLLKPRKETFLMGRVSYTHYKAMEERRKKEQVKSIPGEQSAGEQR